MARIAIQKIKMIADKIDMKKHLFVIALVMFFSGCSAAYIRQWDQSQVVACCKNTGSIYYHCSRPELDQMAAIHCGSAAKAISGGLVESGAAGSAGYGDIRMSKIEDRCITYQCEQK